jgi:hypothetical protein
MKEAKLRVQARGKRHDQQQLDQRSNADLFSMRAVLSSSEPSMTASEIDEIMKEPAYIECVKPEHAPSLQHQAEDQYDETVFPRRVSTNAECDADQILLAKVPVKNTFVQFPLCEPLCEPPTKTAPGALMLQRFKIKRNQVAAIGVVSEQTTCSQLATTRRLPPTDGNSPPPASCVTDSRDLLCSERQSEDEIAVFGNGSQAHALRQCVPCAYFWYKKDGCRKADTCPFCHLCGKGEIKRRKRERLQQLKSDGLYIPNFAKLREACLQRDHFDSEAS